MLRLISMSIVVTITTLLLPAVVDAQPAATPNEQADHRPPNVVLILADDMGFSDIGCYGGEIETPHLDRLAADGLRFTQMYNTARCWPTRACLMTGYYAQQVNRDPQGVRPKWAALLPQLLKPAGYRSYHSGKWHLDGPVLPGGFDRSYWTRGHNRHFNPKTHLLDDQPLPPVEPNSGYYSTTAITQHAIEFLAEHDKEYKDRPFFLYLAFISPHFPLHAPPEDIAKYRDRYLEGWDRVRHERHEKLRELGIVTCGLAELDRSFMPRYLKPEWLVNLGPGETEKTLPWDELTDEQKRFQASKMAVHAAMVDRIDQEVGRLFTQLRKMGAWDDTLIVFLSDNGADATIYIRGDGHDPNADPGSAKTFLCIGPGWSTASNTPFRRHKIWTHEGGTATPFIMHWPARIRDHGALRHSPAHIIDFVPTVLELAGIEPPEKFKGHQRPPMPGLSLAPLLAADVELGHEYLYWHHEGNRALRIGDYKIVSERENDEKWELYNIKDDRIESHNLAEAEPQRLQRMAERWNELDAKFRAQAKTGAQ